MGSYHLAHNQLAHICSSYNILRNSFLSDGKGTTNLQADLEADPIIRGRPVVLQSKDCHALWVSSKVIENSPPLPEVVEGGLIIRDDGGRPTGALFSVILLGDWLSRN